MVEVNRVLTSLLVDYYGRDHQMLKVAEELNELATVIIQCYTKRCRSEELAEQLYSETADVYIMLDQLVCAMLDERELQREIRRKLNRTFERLKNEQRKTENPEEEDVFRRGSEEGYQGSCGRFCQENHADMPCCCG